MMTMSWIILAQKIASLRVREKVRRTRDWMEYKWKVRRSLMGAKWQINKTKNYERHKKNECWLK